MKYVAQDGTVVTDELLESWAKPYDKGGVSGTGGEVTRGRPRLCDESLEVMSFKVPSSMAETIRQAAKAGGETRSAFLRKAAVEKAEQVLNAAS